MKLFAITNKRVAVLIVLLLFGKSYLFAQKQLNFGLTKKQPVETLPKGKAPFQTAVEKPRSGKAGEATALGNANYRLASGWELTDDLTNLLGSPSVFTEVINSKGWYDAVVPGTVLTSLVAAGKFPDPYFGLNNMAITDSLCRKEWWYRTTFETPKNENGKLAWLCFNGINYKARVWLNGHLLGDIKGAFTRGKFQVTDHLKTNGRNVLLVQILPPHNPGIPDEQSALSGMGKNGGVHTLDGPTFFATEGWDWIPGIRDRNMGIWQDVQLSFTGSVTSSDPQVITDLPLPNTTSANVTLRTTVINNSATTQEATIHFSFEGVAVSKKVKLAPGQTLPVVFTPADAAQLNVKNPRLWWPNGYGLPNLYNATIKVTDAKGLEEIKQFRFGIREYAYELMADTEEKQAVRFAYSPTDSRTDKPIIDYTKRRAFKDKIFIPTLRKEFPSEKMQVLSDNDNPFLVIKVNGVAVYCKGGNWGIDDAMKKVSRENLEPAFRLHREANFNMIRNWTGESTEPVFFDLADEYGMLVWNDFWLSTEGFNLNPSDDQLFLDNSLDMIKRYRNHPSIAIWCPRNEGYAPAGIENDLATQVAKEDGTRHYIGNSREINLRQSGPWHFFVNNKDYFSKQGDGFTTEIGTFSVPEASTIRKFIAPEDQWPINDVWHYHDLHTNNQNLEGYLHTADSLYGVSNSLDDFNRKIQLINYDSHRSIFEAWNNKLWNNSSGVLLWMSHPAWPSMIWQTYSWDFQTHGSFYGSKKGCEPLHIQLNLHNNQVIAVNTSLNNVKDAMAVMQVYTMDGKLLQNKTAPLAIQTNAKADVFTATLDEASLPANYLVRLSITDKKGNVLAANEYWKANTATGHFKAFNQLPVVTLSSKATRLANGQIKIELENKTKHPAVGIKLDALDNAAQIVLPAYFSDGYFTLLPGEKKTILLAPVDTKAIKEIKVAGYNLTGTVSIKN
ncbi:glycosyl hydrolase family 2 [Lacibacter cauensis]|uniref:Glycosyl hydrolase family 2 n=1 Tax=Lacibacter cauensis TaxID=510947 RepID=A0A562SS22_9BACT|nr:sugar-binding domain-containing protein [Lacibacter cauensis]TWI83814.1 glycosyl hydrolase family 2 [Lacibacter cauensis]